MTACHKPDYSTETDPSPGNACPLAEMTAMGYAPVSRGQLISQGDCIWTALEQDRPQLAPLRRVPGSLVPFVGDCPTGWFSPVAGYAGRGAPVGQGRERTPPILVGLAEILPRHPVVRATDRSRTPSSRLSGHTWRWARGLRGSSTATRQIIRGEGGCGQPSGPRLQHTADGFPPPISPAQSPNQRVIALIYPHTMLAVWPCAGVRLPRSRRKAGQLDRRLKMQSP